VSGDAARADLVALVGEGPLVVAHIDVVKGSAPREAGTFMLVNERLATGTIGGGSVESRAIEEARAMLGDGRDRVSMSLPLGPALDQCCGGRLMLTLARLTAPPPDGLLWEGGPAVSARPVAPVWIYGAGHVGLALAGALAPLPFAVRLFDGRAAPETQPGGPPVTRLAIPEAALDEAPADALHLVMTHSHALDLEIVAAALRRGVRFLGLIGSATKRATFGRRLEERGLDPAPLVCPIGLPTIRGKAPAVIAASVAAQLLTVAAAEVGDTLWGGG